MVHIIFLSAFVVMFIIEMLTVSNEAVHVGIGSLCTFILSYVIKDIRVLPMYLLLLSLFSYVVLNKIIDKMYEKYKLREKVYARHKGKRAICVENIDMSGGRIVYHGIYYDATSEHDIQRGAIVKLLKYEDGNWHVERYE